MTVFVIITRYSSSIYGNEGYLTNTLPLKPSQIILAKLINFLIWIFISYFVIFVSMFILFPFEFFIRNIIKDTEFYQDLNTIVKEFFSSKYIFISILQLIYNFFAHVQSILIIFLSIAIANLFKSYKVVVGVIAFFIISIIFSFIGASVTYSTISNLDVPVIYGDTDPTIFLSLRNGTITSILYSLISSVLLFFGVHYLHTHNLNLE